MARVKGLDRLQRTLDKIFKDSSANKKILIEIGEFTKSRIFKFTKSGKSIAGKKPKSLKRLSASYKVFRRGEVTFWTDEQGRLRKGNFKSKILNKTGSLFAPDRSNLTLTGQMLDSLKSFVNVGKKTVTVAPTGKRRPVGKRRRVLKNTEVAEFVAENGRPFLGLDDKGIKRVKRIVLDDIRRRIRTASRASKT